MKDSTKEVTSDLPVMEAEAGAGAVADAWAVLSTA